jgi:hypothetical protein
VPQSFADRRDQPHETGRERVRDRALPDGQAPGAARDRGLVPRSAPSKYRRTFLQEGLNALFGIVTAEELLLQLSFERQSLV